MDVKVTEILQNRLNTVVNKTINKVDNNFDFTLKKVSEGNLKNKLDGLIKDITEQGKKLSDHMDVYDMREYRKLIGEFMNEIVTNSHKFSRENFLDSRGRHRVYGIVRKVDVALDELARELIKSEKNNINILDKTDEIKGLLIDLIV